MASRWLSRLSRLLLNKVVPKAFSVQAPIPALVMTLFAIPYTIVLTVQMRGTQNFVDVSLLILFVYEFYILLSILQSFFTFFTNIKYSMMLSRIKHDTNTYSKVPNK
jgi:hypothetical protein